MSRTLQNPEIKRGNLRAVAYSQLDVSVYDDTDARKREVWHGKTLEEAAAFMDAVNPYLDAFKAHALAESPETKAALASTYETIPETHWRGAAITIAFRRFAADHPQN